MINAPLLVSCTMPTYGRPAYVGEAVAMFLADDYPNKELILLNDCPGQTFEFDHPRVRVINEPSRFPTLGDKRNACIEAAAGEIIAIVDDDDVYLPWRLSLTVEQMLRRDTPFYRPASYLAYQGGERLDGWRATPEWGVHGMVAFTKDLWRDAGRYPPQTSARTRSCCRRCIGCLAPSISATRLPTTTGFSSFAASRSTITHRASGAAQARSTRRRANTGCSRATFRTFVCECCGTG